MMLSDDLHDIEAVVGINSLSKSLEAEHPDLFFNDTATAEI